MSKCPSSTLVTTAASLFLASSAQTATGPAAALRAAARRTGQPEFLDDRPQSPTPDGDRTFAPYFHVAGSAAIEALPLKETTAQVDIVGAIARVRVRQVYENRASRPIEAVYVFPASTRAAVHGMRMKIGARTIEARIERRQRARADYDQARERGQRAALLEQERENVFTMTVANLMPRDRIEVELDYSELLVPEDAVYEFVVPADVGPRYPGGADPDRDRWIGSPYLHQGQTEPHRFDVSAHLETGIPLKDVASPSHGIDVTYTSPSSADVRLARTGGGNRDYVLRYRLSGDRIETGLLLWSDRGNGYFALMMEPPQRPEASAMPPREFIFLLDVSGSMSGFPIETAKELLRELLAALRPADRFNLVLFSGSSAVMSPQGSLPATDANLAKALKLIERECGCGGTELMAGLRDAYRIPPGQDGVSRTVVVVTDGFVAVEPQAFRFIRERLDDANLFAFGIGSSVNRALIEGMARAGEGEPFVVLDADKAAAEADRFRAYIDRPVLTDIRVKMRGLDAADTLPDDVPDLLAARPLVLLGRFRGSPHGTIEVTGRSGGGGFRRVVEVRPEAARADNEPLRWLWARRWVATLDDEIHLGHTPELEDAITKLGLDHRLLTRFTSFVAIGSEVVHHGGATATVRQPVPLPDGVPDGALGDLMGDVSLVYGSGGMGLAGTGRSGLGTIGRGGGGGGGAGYGRAVSHLGGRRARAPDVVPGQAVVRGTLDKEIVRRVIRRHMNEVRYCYERELIASPELRGRVTIQFTIGATGQVIASLVQSSDLKNAQVEQCVAQAVRRWLFPRVPGGEPAVVTYPFALRPRRTSAAPPSP